MHLSVLWKCESLTVIEEGKILENEQSACT